MSAIYGAIDLSMHSLDSSLNDIMQKPYHEYSIDSYHFIMYNHVLMGCCQQFITKDSKNEILPINDKERGIYFTADCIIDNRSDLLSKLNLDCNTPDGSLLYQAYLIWGKECTDHVFGNYSFVVYDEQKNQVELFSDHTCSRCLFYHYQNYTLYFSTLLTPIVTANPHNLKPNHRWVIDCATLLAPTIYNDPEETYFQEVFKIKSGSIVTVSKNNVKKEDYWDPFTNQTPLITTDEEYKKQFLDLLSTIITSYLRTNGEVGVLLSSGLDSTTVASLCAPLLQQRKRQLYSFTSVPEPDFVSQLSDYYLTDETTEVQRFCGYFSNIKPHFEAYEGKTLFTEAEEITQILELPSKSQNNAVWLNEICKAAQKDGCKILLDGQTGNTTVSSGRVEEYFYDLFLHGHLKILWKDLKQFSLKYHLSRKHIIKYNVRALSKTLFDQPRKLKRGNIYEKVCTNISYAEQFQTSKRYIQERKNLQLDYINKEKDIKSFMYTPVAYSQIGEIKTKMGLKYGMLLRDPFSDKRMIEFCIRLPMKCFVSEGYERRLIRKYMRGIVPDFILDNLNKRGLQSADNEIRFQKYWPQYQKKFNQQLSKSVLQPYIDTTKLQTSLLAIENDLETGDHLLFRHLMNLYTLSIFIEDFQSLQLT